MYRECCYCSQMIARLHCYCMGKSIFSVQISYRLDWTITSTLFFCTRYFRNCLPISQPRFGPECAFKRTGSSLIMEGVYMTIWTIFPNKWIGNVDGNGSSHRLISWIPWFISSGIIFPLEFHEEPCLWHARQFWNGPGGTNIHRCDYDPWNARFFLTCPPIHVASMSCSDTCQWLQVWTPPVMLFVIFFIYYLFVCV